jgi:Na+/H+ antiporter NhaC
LKKELYIFGGIFLFLAIGMHFKEWIDHPVKHAMELPNAGAYGIGAIHPLVFTAALYLMVLIVRKIVGLFGRKTK